VEDVRWPVGGMGLGVAMRRGFPTLHWGKIPAPDRDGDRDQSSCRDGGQFSPRPRPHFLVLGDIPSPSPLSYLWFGKNSHPHLFLLAFS